MKKFTLFLVVTVLLILGLFVYRDQKNKVFINPIDLAQFNRIVPIKENDCEQKSAIKYYYYEDVSEKEYANNKFGLYIYADNERFIELADKLVNSNGGDWGYVLIPYNVKDKDRDKWTRVFYLLNKKHLIPIVQLWDVEVGDYEKQTRNAAKFLNSFAWPIKQRYVSVYNEPNDAKFWYGRVDPAEYANILEFTIDTFKKANEDFFMLNGAFNVSAATTPTSLDSFEYMRQMNEEVPGIFSKLDGWASHSYPQPNFTGSPYATGRWSIKAYEEELRYLNGSFNVNNLPVFITETGWAHDIGRSFDNSFLSMEEVTSAFKVAYEEIWLPDERVVAVTPFSVWYESPADHFSWVDDRWVPYEQFQAVKALKKVAGNPEKLSVSETLATGCD